MGEPPSTEHKRFFIHASFDALGEKIARLEEFFNSGRGEEALLLCCCYIDGLAAELYWPKKQSNRNFVRALCEHGGEDALRHIHPRQLKIGFEASGAPKVQQLGERVVAAWGKAQDKLYSEEEVCALLRDRLTPPAYGMLKGNLWRGTLANTAYQKLRIPLVHRLGAPDAVTFPETEFGGQRVPDLDFRLLYRALVRIFETARRLSVEA